MRIHFNGQLLELPDASCISQLLQSQQLGERRVAVEVNGSIVPRSRHDEYLLRDGDAVEVVQALGGG